MRACELNGTSYAGSGRVTATVSTAGSFVASTKSTRANRLTSSASSSTGW